LGWRRRLYRTIHGNRREKIPVNVETLPSSNANWQS
jgi:hypothetical protein